MNRKGFTLVEMLVSITIISILAGIVTFNILDGLRQSRDAERKSDILTIQTAIELYKQRNNEYPRPCNGPGNWSGEPGSDVECSGADGRYIEGLEPYIPSLPTDPEPDGSSTGYRYLTNADQTEYVLKAYNTLETDTLPDAGGCGDDTKTYIVWGGFASDSHSGCDLN